MSKRQKVFFVVDVESTGPDFSKHSMYQFACVPVTSAGEIFAEGVRYDVELISDEHDNDTMKFLYRELNITPYTLAKRRTQISALEAMGKFDEYISAMLTMADNGASDKAPVPVFVADNLAFDWGFVNTYFHRFLGRNPFGYSGRNLPCLSLGFYGSRDKWEQFRTVKHTHDALDDVRGNAGALAHMIKDGLKLS